MNHNLKWIKKGLIFVPVGNLDWMRTHAQLPFADRLEKDLYRIYFCSRDSKNRSSTGYVEIDIKNPYEILYLTEKPVLSPGDLGTFDDSGVMASSLVDHKGKKYIYYTGWNLSVTVPFRWSIGLAISNDGGKTFERYSKAPIMDRSHLDPFFVGSPTVIFEDGMWKMWYISSKGWEIHDNKPRAPYFIKYAESEDGVEWKRENITCLNLKGDEVALGRASILRENDHYNMWYSIATDHYRIGYADSLDGINWTRKDNLVSIDVSHDGWDSESVEYTHVFNHNGRKYMLYNGNGYGKTGFGYAILE